MSRSEFSQVEKEFTRALSEVPGDVRESGFVAGISGGLDSMVMLHLFHLCGLKITVAHVNYRQRGGDSGQDEAFVADAARRYDYPYKLLTPDAEDLRGGNFQDKARKVRYGFFADSMLNCGHGAIALAHQQDDQIETLLMKVFRGAGAESWTGMSVWEVGLFRPLLMLPRKQIVEYANEYRISHREDKSNLGNKYARNLIRNEFYPELKRLIPGIRQNILKLPKIASSATMAMDWISERVTNENGHLDAPELLKMVPALRSPLILYLVKKKFHGMPVSTGSLTRLKDLESLQAGKFIELSNNIRIYREKDSFRIAAVQVNLSHESQDRISQDQKSIDQISPDQTLKPIAPGDHTSERKKTVTAAVTETDEHVIIDPDQLKNGEFNHYGYIFSLENQAAPFDGTTLQLNISGIDGGLTLRRWKPGDRFVPFGMTGSQLVSDHLTNRRIVGSEKKEVFVLTTFEGNVCAVIFPHSKNRKDAGTIDNRFALDGKSKRILRIRTQ